MSEGEFTAMVKGFCAAIGELRIQQEDLFQRQCSLNLMLANNTTWAGTAEWMINELGGAFANTYPKAAGESAKLGKGLIESRMKLRGCLEEIIRRNPCVEMAICTNRDWAKSTAEGVENMALAFAATRKVITTAEKLKEQIRSRP